MYKLRDYQQTIYDSISSIWTEKEKLEELIKFLVVAVTRSGKTVIFATISKKMDNVDRGVLIITHVDVIANQILEKLSDMGISAGQIKSNKAITRNNIQVAMVKTLKNRLIKQERMKKPPFNFKKWELVQKPRLIIIDEAHHCVSKTFKDVLAYFPDVPVIGFTATACRLDNKPLFPTFDTMIQGKSMKDMISDYWITNYRHLCPRSPLEDIKLKLKGKDYESETQTKKMTTIDAVGDIIHNYEKYLGGLQTIAFCCSLKHANIMKDKFDSAGHKSQIIEAKSKNRIGIIERYRSGEYPILISIGIINEGFDIDVCYGVLLLRKTKSLSLYLQQVSRCLTPIFAEGYNIEIKEQRKMALQKAKPFGVIIDFVGNVWEHGKLDEHREWSLHGLTKKQKKENMVKKWTCSGKDIACGFSWEMELMKCPACGYDRGKNIAVKKQVEVNELKEQLIDVNEIEEIEAESLSKVILRIKEYKNSNSAMMAILHQKVRDGEENMKQKIEAMCSGLGYADKYKHRVWNHLREQYGDRMEQLG